MHLKSVPYLERSKRKGDCIKTAEHGMTYIPFLDSPIFGYNYYKSKLWLQFLQIPCCMLPSMMSVENHDRIYSVIAHSVVAYSVIGESIIAHSCVMLWFSPL